METKFVLTIVGWFFLTIAWGLFFFSKKYNKILFEKFGVMCLVISFLIFMFNIVNNLFDF